MLTNQQDSSPSNQQLRGGADSGGQGSAETNAGSVLSGNSSQDSESSPGTNSSACSSLDFDHNVDLCRPPLESTQVNLVSSTTNSLMQDLHNAPTLTSVELAAAHPQQEGEKKAIYAHPLFPLLSNVLERCEAATAQLDSQSGKESLDAEIHTFLQQRDAALDGSNRELDELLVEAVQVLGIHIIELEKVNELCRDFCSRYINTVRCRYQQADFLQHDSLPNSPSSESGDASPNLGLAPQQVAGAPGQHNGFYGHPAHPGLYSTEHHHLLQGAYPHYAAAYPAAPHPGHHAALMAGSHPLHHHGGSHIPLPLHHGTGGGQAPLGSPTDSLDDKGKQKRGVLPKRATQIMKQWLFQHLVHPYPTEDEKRQLATQTNLTLLQVNNWFINARRRILQPMLDASSPESTQKKKKTQQNRPSNVRFWPANLTNQVPVKTSSTPAVSTSASAAAEVKEEAPSAHRHLQQQEDNDCKAARVLYPQYPSAPQGFEARLPEDSDDCSYGDDADSDGQDSNFSSSHHHLSQTSATAAHSNFPMTAVPPDLAMDWKMGKVGYE